MNVTQKDTLRALAIMAHGSRAQAANSEFLCTIDAMRQALSHDYARIGGVFLELCEPSLQTLGVEWAEQGVTHLDVYPMFFNQGKHVRRDIPKQIETLSAACPNLTVRQLPYLGSSQHFSSFMCQHLKESIRGYSFV